MLKVKIDNKEKFHFITLEEEQVAANMTEELSTLLSNYLDAPVKNVVINMQQVKTLDMEAAEMLANIQQKFYDNNCSFVICQLTTEVEKFLDEEELLEVMNVTLTESEAGDILQMEEIERELLGF